MRRGQTRYLLQRSHRVHRLLHALHRMDGQSIDGFLRRVGLGDHGHIEAQFGGLLESLLPPRRGAHFARQTVVQVRWDEHESRLRSCWTSDDPARWAAATAGYDTGAAWQTTATGGWNVTPAAGGSIATYRVWADVQTVIPGLQSWAMARSLPSMIVAYDARVGALAGSK